MVKKLKPEHRLYLSKERARERKSKLKQLTDAYSLPEYFGELFLSELRIDKHPDNDKARKRAKILGLY